RQERARAELGARIAQMGEGQQQAQSALQQRMIDQERALQEQFERISMRVSLSVDQAANQTRDTLTALRERLAVVDEAQRNITALSSQMVSLQDILANKQARGAFGEIQLRDIVEAVLPPDAYEFQAPVGDGLRVDCLIRLPNPPGPIAIDAKFPLESYQRLTGAQSDAERIQAARDFSADVLKHVRAIAGKYIVPGQTGDAALMFLPSEAIYAELHARYANVVEQSFRERVFIVSPTTLWATLNTIRAVFRDVRMREQAGLLQKELHVMMEDVGRLDERVEKLAVHFRQASKDVDDIQVSARKVSRRAERITALDLGDEEPGVAMESARSVARGWAKGGATPPSAS
ncbi:MAG: DNA recombination protein RmuC, partial [Rhodospirillaceae bacterium]|nr:DNA recombination protein RmuC [Rhodospirillaceae bacterium]